MTKYTRIHNSTYAKFLRSYNKAVAEFATQITVENSEDRPKVRKSVRTSLALGGIGAGYALGKNPEAQEVLRSTGVDIKDRAIDKALDFRTKYNIPEDVGVKSVARSVAKRLPAPPDGVALPNMFGNYPSSERAAEAAQVANDLGLNPSRWFGGQ